MTAPAAMAFSSLVAVTGLIFALWHMWHYDRWRCLLPTRHDWFRALMCHILLWSVMSFVAYTWMDVKVLYAEYYISLEGMTIVAPWQLWTAPHQKLWKASIYILTFGWVCLQAVHLEEFLYWAYLISSLRTGGGPKSSWLSSIYFRIWLVACGISIALLFGAVSIDRANLDMMRAYLFMVGSCMSVLLAAASIALVVVFPNFVATTKKQGAAPEVLERLYFFAEMNQIRTVFRVIYSLAFLLLSADALTTAKKINSSDFWADTLFLCGQLSIFASTCLSVVVLLPRNMTSESLPIHNENFHPLEPYKRPLPPQSGRHFHELGNRLNVDRDALGVLAEGDENIELSPHGKGSNDEEYGNLRPHPQPDTEAPFAGVADRTKRARYSEFPSLPAVVQKFRSPFETSTPNGSRKSGPTQVFVTTSHTVHEE